MEQEVEEETISVEELVLSNTLILPIILDFLPFRQFLASRLVSRTWNEGVRGRMWTRAKMDLSLCSMVKKGEERKRSQVEDKLDSIQYLGITSLILGIEDQSGLHPTIALSFTEVGPFIRSLTLKMNLEKGPDFSDFSTLLTNCPNLKELEWWGAINEEHSHTVHPVFTSVETLSLGFYPGEMPNMGRRAVLWVCSVFPNVRSFSCLPHHREGVVRFLLSSWGETEGGFKPLPQLSQLTLHLIMMEEGGEDGGLAPLLYLPRGLTLLNLSINGKRGTGSVQEFRDQDASILKRVLERQGPTLEKLVINFLNLWKPKPLVVVIGLPPLPKLQYFTVKSDFSGDISIDFRPLDPGMTAFPNLLRLSLPYLWGEGIKRFLESSGDWGDCCRLREIQLKVVDKVGSPWMKGQSPEWVRNAEVLCSKAFPNAELLDWSTLYT